MSWTDERVDLLKKLWSEGRSAAEIAKELGGVTRNAVIGKAHRLKLSNRVSPIQQNNKPAAAKPAAKKADKAVVELASAIKPSIPAAKPPSREAGPLMDLLDLKPRMCRWPVGDPHDETFGFCGQEVIMGLPYCCEHAKMAYQAATRNRIIQAENALSTVGVLPEAVDGAQGKQRKSAG